LSCAVRGFEALRLLGDGRDSRSDDAHRVALELMECLDGPVPERLVEAAMRLVVHDDDLMDAGYPLDHLAGGQEAIVALVHAVRAAAADGALDEVMFAAEAAVNAADAEAMGLMPEASEAELAQSHPVREERRRQWDAVLEIESRGVEVVRAQMRARLRAMSGAGAATGRSR
jgi:hypothetical protein